MYTHVNFKTKKALREAIARGDRVTVYQPNADITGHYGPTNGDVTLEGPHYPKPHTWYARVRIEGGVIIKLLS